MLDLLLAILIAVLPACESEDSNNCYFDAQISGNGRGTSFIDLNGSVYYA